jgi:hypothetical protein
MPTITAHVCDTFVWALTIENTNTNKQHDVKATSFFIEPTEFVEKELYENIKKIEILKEIKADKGNFISFFI